MKLLQLVRADFVKGLWGSRRYPVEALVALISLGVMFGMLYGAKRLAAGGDNAFLQSLVAFIMWYLVLIVVGSMSTDIQTEAEQGTLEQWLLAPASPARLLLSRLLAVVLRGILELLVVFGALLLITRTTVSWHLVPVLVVLGLSLLGLAGFGYMLAGLTLLIKRTSNVVGFFNLLLLIVMAATTGAVSGVTLVVAKVLPLTYGAHLLSQVLSSASPPGGSDWMLSLAILSANSLVYVAVGFIIFVRAERVARQRGIIAHF